MQIASSRSTSGPPNPSMSSRLSLTLVAESNSAPIAERCGSEKVHADNLRPAHMLSSHDFSSLNRAEFHPLAFWSEWVPISGRTTAPRANQPFDMESVQQLLVASNSTVVIGLTPRRTSSVTFSHCVGVVGPRICRIGSTVLFARSCLVREVCDTGFFTTGIEG